MKKEAEIELNRARGQLRYLKTLAQNKTQLDEEDAQNKNEQNSTESEAQQEKIVNETKECAICQEIMKKEDDIVILLCGHTFCCQCIMMMVDKAIHGTIKCPTCRTRMNTSELTFISGPSKPTSLSGSQLLSDDETNLVSLDNQAIELQEQEEENQIEVKGSWGTKIEGVVRTIMYVQKKARERKEKKGKEKDIDIEAIEDPTSATPAVNDVKCLVFSQWDDVLLLVSR